MAVRTGKGVNKAILPQRRWAFTCFEVEDLLYPEEYPDLRYMVYQLEKCPDTGRDHFQGYLELSKPQRLSALKKFKGLEGAHWSVARTAAEYNVAYCTKEGRLDGPWTHGTLDSSGQGKRSDLVGLKRRIDEGATSLQLLDDPETMPQWFKYSKSIEKAIFLKAPKRTTMTKLYVLLGKTGMGKSHMARIKAGPDAYYKPRGHGTADWWDGYAGKENIVIDDFYGWIKYDTMLRMCDQYPHTVEIKGGTVNFNSSKVFITSGKAPEDWYPNIRDKSMLFRRIHKVLVFYELGKAYSYGSYAEYLESGSRNLLPGNDVMEHIE